MKWKKTPNRVKTWLNCNKNLQPLIKEDVHVGPLGDNVQCWLQLTIQTFALNVELIHVVILNKNKTVTSLQNILCNSKKCLVRKLNGTKK